MSAPGSEAGGNGRTVYLLLTVGLFLLLAPLLAVFGDRLAGPVFGLPLSGAQWIALGDILLILVLSWRHVRSADGGGRS